MLFDKIFNALIMQTFKIDVEIISLFCQYLPKPKFILCICIVCVTPLVDFKL